MKKLISLFGFLLIIYLALFANSTFAQDADMTKDALKYMKEWSKGFSPEQYRYLGFEDRADFMASVLDRPYVLYTIDPNDLVEYETGDGLDQMLTETGYLVYPIVSEGRTRALLWMYEKEGEWKIARIGSSGLGKNLSANKTAINREREERGLVGEESTKLVRIYQLYFDFFFVKGADSEYVIPMQSISELKVEGSTFYSTEEIVPMLRDQLREMMPFRDTESGKIKEY